MFYDLYAEFLILHETNITMSASAEMPYFIKPSVQLIKEDKIQAYKEAIQAIDANLVDQNNPILKMATINCILKTYLPYYYWVGFYEVKDSRLEVGPYQGTLGCLYIDFGRGVCGHVAESKKTQIVEDCHTLEQGTAHIACDPNSQSEIVVPVFNKNKELIAVFDVDSTLKGSFDEIDRLYLEKIMNYNFSEI